MKNKQKKEEKHMQLVDKDGNDLSTKPKNIEKFDDELGKIITKTAEPAINKLKLLGSQNQQDFIYMLNLAQQNVDRILMYKIIEALGKESINELISEDDLKHVSADLSNMITNPNTEESETDERPN